MTFISSVIGTAERMPLPDVIVRAAIQRLCSRTAARLASVASDASFANEMAARGARTPPSSFRGDAKASNPESRDSGFAARPGMTNRHCEG